MARAKHLRYTSKVQLDERFSCDLEKQLTAFQTKTGMLNSH